MKLINIILFLNLFFIINLIYSGSDENLDKIKKELVIAIESGDIEYIQNYFKQMAPIITDIDQEGNSAITLAIRNQKIDDETRKKILELIFKESNNPIQNLIYSKARDSKLDRTPLMWVIEKNKLDLLDLLLKYITPDILNHVDENYETALTLAISKPNVKFLDRLLKEKNLDINLMSSDGTTPLIKAIQASRIEPINKLLQDSKIDVNKLDKKGLSPLINAFNYKLYDIVSLLLQNKNLKISDKDLDQINNFIQGAGTEQVFFKDYFNFKDKNNENILFRLVDKAKPNEILINKILNFKSKPDINLQNNNGDTVAMLAADLGHKKILELLIKNGANLNLKTKDNKTALTFAFEKDHKDIVNLLLQQKNIDLNSKDENGNTVLMWAAGNGYQDIVEEILKNKTSDINAKNNSGNTALIGAAAEGFDAIVKLLLAQKGIDINIKNNDNETAFDLAKTESIKKILISEFKPPITPTSQAGKPEEISIEKGRKLLADLNANLIGLAEKR